MKKYECCENIRRIIKTDASMTGHIQFMMDLIGCNFNNEKDKKWFKDIVINLQKLCNDALKELE